VEPTDLQANPPSSFTIIASAPASKFALNTNSPAQTTLTAVTDTGYTASVTVNLEQVESTTAPVNEGDAVYTWAVPNNEAVSTWVQQISENTVNTVQLSSSSGLP
jgi:hypothetical protein